MISLIAFIFTIGILVFFHELGHYLAARSVGVKVEKFYIGFNIFGYSIFKKVINGTEYGIGWLPLGGYVKLAGMLDESFDTSHTNEPTDFHNKPCWAKIWVMSAGVIMNFLLAMLIIFITIYAYGIPKPVSNEPIVYKILESSYQSSEQDFQIKSAAYTLGLIPGDKIIQINDTLINTWDDMSSVIRSSPNKNILIKWERNNKILYDSVLTNSFPGLDGTKRKEIGMIGIEREFYRKKIGIIDASILSTQATKNLLFSMISHLYALIKGELSFKELSGPIGIAQVAGNQAKMGLEPFLSLLAILSINLGLINILPVPGLDGGHVFITLIEWVIGRELSFNLKMGIQQVGVLLLLLLFVFIMVNDISRLF